MLLLRLRTRAVQGRDYFAAVRPAASAGRGLLYRRLQALINRRLLYRLLQIFRGAVVGGLGLGQEWLQVLVRLLAQVFFLQFCGAVQHPLALMDVLGVDDQGALLDQPLQVLDAIRPASLN